MTTMMIITISIMKAHPLLQVRSFARYMGSRIAVHWRGLRCGSYTLPYLDALPIYAFHVFRGPILGNILRTADDKEVACSTSAHLS